MFRRFKSFRIPLLTVGFLLILGGYMLLASSPDAELDTVVRNVKLGTAMTFWGGLMVIVAVLMS